MQATRPRFSLNQILASIIALISAGIIINLQWSKLVDAETDRPLTEAAYRREEKQIEANIDLASKIPSLGFDNLVASWAFLNFVQYFGDETARDVTGYSVTPKFFEVAVTKDPKFLDMYPMLSSTITLFSGRPKKSIELLESGLSRLPEPLKPDAYFLWQAKATDELLFLGDPKSAQQSYLKAAEWASLSDDEEIQAIALRSMNTASFLAQNPDSRSAQVASWFNILSSAVDDRTRTRAVEQIQALGGEVTFNNGAVSISFPEE